MPTYHLAVVVDDYLMQITHAFRGEEWLPSAPVHLLLWKYLGWADAMPEWAHLPLILKPDGHGKLSKRDGERLGFPVFAMDWTDPRSGEKTTGFRERGFLPGAFVNMLAMLGWNPGTEQELFSMDELIAAFSMDRVHKGGAKFDFEKAKWFNQQYIQKTGNEQLAALLPAYLPGSQPAIPAAQLQQALAMVKERLHTLDEFWGQASFLFAAPEQTDMATLQAKWNESLAAFFRELAAELENTADWSVGGIEALFQELVAKLQVKKGEVMLPFRIMLVGGKFGPGVFDIAAFIGRAATVSRIKTVLAGL